MKKTDIRQPIVLASKLYKNPVCVEVGVLSGDHAVAMFCLLNPKMLYLIDSWVNETEMYNEVCDKFDTNKCVQVIRSDSVQASYMISEELNIVYIDADHSYESVLRDMGQWYGKIKTGGMLSGHDWNKPDTGVKKAVKDFCKLNSLKYNISDNDRNWWIIK